MRAVDISRHIRPPHIAAPGLPRPRCAHPCGLWSGLSTLPEWLYILRMRHADPTPTWHRCPRTPGGHCQGVVGLGKGVCVGGHSIQGARGGMRTGLLPMRLKALTGGQLGGPWERSTGREGGREAMSSWARAAPSRPARGPKAPPGLPGQCSPLHRLSSLCAGSAAVTQHTARVFSNTGPPIMAF